jgi:hypothetical protein
MDWIEQLFGVSPDGGSGALELVIALLVALIVVVVVMARRGLVLRRRGSRNH